MFRFGLQRHHVHAASGWTRAMYAVAMAFLLAACHGAGQETTAAVPPERLDA